MSGYYTRFMGPTCAVLTLVLVSISDRIDSTTILWTTIAVAMTVAVHAFHLHSRRMSLRLSLIGTRNRIVIFLVQVMLGLLFLAIASIGTEELVSLESPLLIRVTAAALMVLLILLFDALYAPKKNVE